MLHSQNDDDTETCLLQDTIEQGGQRDQNAGASEPKTCCVSHI